MGNASISEVIKIKEGADKLTIKGLCSLSNNYATGGDLFDISAYFTGTPIVILSPTVDGYGLVHDLGTAVAGKVMALKSLSTEAVNGHDMSAQEAYFSATGQTY